MYFQVLQVLQVVNDHQIGLPADQPPASQALNAPVRLRAGISQQTSKILLRDRHLEAAVGNETDMGEACVQLAEDMRDPGFGAECGAGGDPRPVPAGFREAEAPEGAQAGRVVVQKPPQRAQLVAPHHTSVLGDDEIVERRHDEPLEVQEIAGHREAHPDRISAGLPVRAERDARDQETAGIARVWTVAEHTAALDDLVPVGQRAKRGAFRRSDAGGPPDHKLDQGRGRAGPGPERSRGPRLACGRQVRPDGGYARAIYDAGGTLLGQAPVGNRKDVRNAVEAARGEELIDRFERQSREFDPAAFNSVWVGPWPAVDPDANSPSNRQTTVTTERGLIMAA